ncbi:MAG TPA: GntG family PLP-dependent aldolase [Candidatus Limnocylindria bacterium]
MTDVMPRIDLRSDTVTLPSPGMRRAIYEAEVGDDQYGEDPSVNRLQEEVAGLLGKEASLFLPTGTMADQVALRALTRPGDSVVVPWGSHVELHETGGAAANAGVQLVRAGDPARRGRFTADDFRAVAMAHGHMLYPPTTLAWIENTHNRGGGLVFPKADAVAICAAAHDHGAAAFCDGARLLNAAVASGRPAAELSDPFDLVSLALSKGLGAPGGSMLAGSAALIDVARRHRRMLGGAMRQAGILAAAGLYALAHNVERLAEDHANARLLADRLAESDAFLLDPEAVETNIVVFDLADRPAVPDAPAFVAACRERGVLLNAFGPRTARAVTHLDVDTDACSRAAEVMRSVA